MQRPQTTASPGRVTPTAPPPQVGCANNDSDLAEAVRIVRVELKRKVGLLCPCYPASRRLPRYSTFVRCIDAPALAASQFPLMLTDAIGTFHKPPTW